MDDSEICLLCLEHSIPLFTPYVHPIYTLFTPYFPISKQDLLVLLSEMVLKMKRKPAQFETYVTWKC